MIKGTVAHTFGPLIGQRHDCTFMWCFVLCAWKNIEFVVSLYIYIYMCVCMYVCV